MPPTPAAVNDSAISPRPVVLIVDDDATVRSVMKLGLEKAGLQVDTAADGKQAMASLRRQAYDWVVTDIVMPDCDGLELVQMARQRHPAVRVIAMSGGDMGRTSNYLQMARYLGAAHVLQKPFGYAELVALIVGPARPPGDSSPAQGD